MIVDQLESISTNYVPLKEHPQYLIQKYYPYDIINTKTNSQVFDRISTTNYITVYIDRKPLKKHRLIGEQFIPNPEHFTQVRFKDGDKHNYHLENLYWAGFNDTQRMKNQEKKLGITRLQKELQRLDVSLNNGLISEIHYEEKHKRLNDELNRLKAIITSSTSSSESE